MGNPVPGQPQAAPRFVFRAARSRTWIKDNQINPNAFRRRPERDLGGLSVAYTYEDAVASLTTCHGVIKIDVEALAARGLRIEHGGRHANICEVPFDTPENQSEVLKYAAAIIQCGEVVTGP